MRLGILGPAQGDLVLMARASQYLLDVAQVDKVVYVGNDDALDRVVAGWAQRIVGAGDVAGGLFERAAERCATGSADAIDAFLEAEHALQRLRVLMSVPNGQRSIEIIERFIVLLVYDKGTLDTDDIGAAHVLVFGRSREPLIKNIGARTFVAPGALSAEGGAAILEETQGTLRIALRSADGKLIAEDQHTLGAAGAKMKVQGG